MMPFINAIRPHQKSQPYPFQGPPPKLHVRVRMSVRVRVRVQLGPMGCPHYRATWAAHTKAAPIIGLLKSPAL